MPESRIPGRDEEYKFRFRNPFFFFFSSIGDV